MDFCLVEENNFIVQQVQENLIEKLFEFNTIQQHCVVRKGLNEKWQNRMARECKSRFYKKKS